MRTLKLTLAYDGTRFVGWQRQADGESVQGLVEASLAALQGSPVTLQGAGRTDAGVHALGQVASAEVTFPHDPASVGRALNVRLPLEIRVMEVAEAPEGFHARFSARGKAYRYQLATGPVVSPFVQRFAWLVPAALDVPAMQVAAAALVGTHDFAAFQSTGTPVTTSVRTITRSEVSLRQAELPAGASHPLLVYDVEGDGFLRHMVRAIAGTLVEVGRGSRPAGSMAGLLAGRSRASAGPTAPAHGLFLVRVDY